MPTITKTTSEVYQLRVFRDSVWADITIHVDGPQSGRIQIASDYGDWQRYWGSCGVSFKEFLTKLNLGYVSRKFNVDRYFDADKNMDMWKRRILSLRRDLDITADKARELWEELISVECDSKEEFCAHITGCEGIYDLFHDQLDVWEGI